MFSDDAQSDVNLLACRCWCETNKRDALNAGCCIAIKVLEAVLYCQLCSLFNAFSVVLLILCLFSVVKEN